MSAIVMYGIKNCDSVKKAKGWLETHGVSYRFHDLRSEGIDRPLIDSWLEKQSWETLLNKRSTTWRQLSEQEQDVNDNNISALLLANPTLIKRPVIVVDGEVIVGFSEKAYSEYFNK